MTRAAAPTSSATSPSSSDDRRYAPEVRTDARDALLALLELTSQLTEDRPLEDFLRHVTDTAQKLIAADHVSIRLLDATKTSLLCGARSGTGAGDRPMDFKRGEGVIGWVVDHAEALRIDEVAKDPRYKAMPQTFAVTAMMAEPLWAAGEVIGVLSVTSPDAAAFGDEDQLLLRLLASCSSPAIDRARLKRLATFDDLTMAMSQRYLYPKLVEELERARRSHGEVSVLLMDLDHFKRVNDTHGHAAGDAALRQFADRVRASVRRLDVLVRRGGEEFVLIMPQTGPTQALATASRIREATATQPFELTPALKIAQTVSIGVATWDGAESPGELETRADAAMYEAKQSGRNRVVVSPRPSQSGPLSGPPDR